MTGSGGSEVYDELGAAIERAQDDLETTWVEYDAVAYLDGQLRAVYGTALFQIGLDISSWNECETNFAQVSAVGLCLQ